MSSPVQILEVDIRDFLAGIESIAAVVENRVFGVVRPRNTPLPQVLITRVTTTRQNTICGTSTLVSCDLQIDSFALQGQDAWQLATLVRRALMDFSGTMGATSVNKIFLTNEFPLTDPEPGVLRVTQTYNVWYYEER